MKHLFSPNSGEDKKNLHQEWNTFFPYSSTDQRSDAHQSQIIRGDAGEDHTQSVGGIHSKYWGDISPLPGFGTPVCHVVLFFSSWDPQWNKRLFSQQTKKFVLLQKQRDLPIIKMPCDTASIL